MIKNRKKRSLIWSHLLLKCVSIFDCFHFPLIFRVFRSGQKGISGVLSRSRKFRAAKKIVTKTSSQKFLIYSNFFESWIIDNIHALDDKIDTKTTRLESRGVGETKFKQIFLKNFIMSFLSQKYRNFELLPKNFCLFLPRKSHNQVFYRKFCFHLVSPTALLSNVCLEKLTFLKSSHSIFLLKPADIKNTLVTRTWIDKSFVKKCATTSWYFQSSNFFRECYEIVKCYFFPLKMYF